MQILENICPRCSQGNILYNFIMLNKECENCGYVFEAEQGAFTGALYLNLTMVGLSTFPFFCLLFIPQVNIAGIAALTIFWILISSPFTLRFSKIIWVKMLYKQNPS